MNRLFFGSAIIAVLLLIPAISSCKKDGPEQKEEEMTLCIQYKDMEIKSQAMGRTMKYNVLTPPSFDPSEDKYNVIYLLHGYGDDNNAWLSSPQDRGGQTSLASRMYQAVKNGEITKTVVVMPDGLTTFYTGEWETYFYKELIPEVEKKFNIDGKRSRRAIAGLSMGGYGSAYHGLSHPDMFCAVYTMSMANEFMGEFRALATQNKSKLPDFYVVNGEQDTTVGKAPEEFVAMMAEVGITCGYDHWLGTHDWKFWGECIPKFLTWIGQEFKKNQ